jgi:hypothetical protein
MIDHRIVGEEFANLDLLLLDEQSVTACWAWQTFCPGMRIAGIIYNEIRKATPGRPGETRRRALCTSKGKLEKYAPVARPRGAGGRFRT